jgi:hypothetical protein
MRTRIPQIPCSIIPCGNPIRVTIMATSPLRTMPNPIIREYFPDILKKFCRNPAANNLGNNSINSKDNQKSDSGGRLAITPGERENIAAKKFWRYSASS